MHRMLQRTDMVGGMGIAPKTNFRTTRGTFRAGERATRLQEVCQTRVRITPGVLLELHTLSSLPRPTRVV